MVRRLLPVLLIAPLVAIAVAPAGSPGAPTVAAMSHPATGPNLRTPGRAGPAPRGEYVAILGGVAPSFLPRVHSLATGRVAALTLGSPAGRIVLPLLDRLQASGALLSFAPGPQLGTLRLHGLTPPGADRLRGLHAAVAALRALPTRGSAPGGWLLSLRRAHLSRLAARSAASASTNGLWVFVQQNLSLNGCYQVGTYYQLLTGVAPAGAVVTATAQLPDGTMANATTQADYLTGIFVISTIYATSPSTAYYAALPRGTVLTVQAAGITRAIPINLTASATSSGTVSGSGAAPGGSVDVVPGSSDGYNGPNRQTVPANGGGSYTASFGPNVGSYGFVYASVDSAGDIVATPYSVPGPLSLSVPDTVSGVAAPGSTVTATELSPSSTAVQTATMSTDGCSGSFNVVFGSPVTPGDTIAVGDSVGSPVRSMHIVSLNVIPNVATGQATVAADPNDVVTLYGTGASSSGVTSTVQTFWPPYYGFLSQSGTADSSGVFTATFAPGEFAPGFTGQVQEQDPSGNSEYRTYAVPALQVLEGGARLQAALPFTGPYTVTLSNPAGAVQSSGVVNPGPWIQNFAWDFTNGAPITIVAGSTVTVTNGIQSASLTVGTLSVNANIAAQTVSGNEATPGSQVSIRIHSGTRVMAPDDAPSIVTTTIPYSSTAYSATVPLGRPNRVEVSYDTSDATQSSQTDQVYAIGDLPLLVADLTGQSVSGTDTPSTYIVASPAANNTPNGQLVSVSSSATTTVGSVYTCATYCSSPGQYGPAAVPFGPGDAITMTDQVGNVVPFSVVSLGITNTGSTISGNGPPNTPLTVMVTPPYYVAGCASTSTPLPVTTDAKGAYTTTVPTICSGETLLVTYQDAQQNQETASATSSGPPPPTSPPVLGQARFHVLVGNGSISGSWYTANTTVTGTLTHNGGAQVQSQGTSSFSRALTLVFTGTAIASGDTISLTDGVNGQTISVNLGVAVSGSGTSLTVTAPPNTKVYANIIRPPASLSSFCGDAVPRATAARSRVKPAVLSRVGPMLSGTTDGTGQAVLDATHTQLGHLAGGDYALYIRCGGSGFYAYDSLPIYYVDPNGNDIMTNYVVPNLGVEVGTDLVAGSATTGATVTVSLQDPQGNVLTTTTTQGRAPGYFDVCFTQGGECGVNTLADGPYTIAPGDSIQVTDQATARTTTVTVPSLTAAANYAGTFVSGTAGAASAVYVVAHTRALSASLCAPYDLAGCRANNVTPLTVTTSSGTYVASFTSTVFSPGDFGDSYLLDSSGATFYAFWDVDPTAQQGVSAPPTATASSTATASATPGNTVTATPPPAPTNPPFTPGPTFTPPPPSTATSVPSPTATGTPAPSGTATATPPPSATATFQPTNTPILVSPTTTPTPTATAATTAPVTPTVDLVPIESESISPDSAAVLQAVLTLPGEGTNGTGTKQLFRLLVPAGSVTQTVTISVSAATLATLPSGTNSITTGANVEVGTAIDLTATNTHTGQHVHHFERPLTLQLSYDPRELAGLGIDPATLQLAYFQPSSGTGSSVISDTATITGTWIPVPTTVDAEHHLLTARIPHFTLFAVRATAHTQAQVQKARARLATLAAGGPPTVSVLPTTNIAPTVDRIPVVVTFPRGQQHAPVDLLITGKPGAAIAATFALGGSGTSALRAVLDTHGYATLRFTPAHALSLRHNVRVSLIVRGTSDSQSLNGSFVLLPGAAAKGAATVDLTAAPSLGLVLKVGVAPVAARRSQKVTVTIATAPKAAIAVGVYHGPHRVASRTASADAHGVHAFVFDAGSLLPAGGKTTLVARIAVQSGGHQTSQRATIVIIP